MSTWDRDGGGHSQHHSCREYARRAHWVEPNLVGEIEHRQWLAARVRSCWGNVRFDDGVPNSPDRLDDAAAVAIYYRQVPDGQPLTSGDRGDEGFNLYTDTIAGAPVDEVQLRVAALRVVDDDPDVPLSVLPTYVLHAHGIQVSVRAHPDGPTVVLVNQTWPAGTTIHVLHASHTPERTSASAS